MYLYMSTPPVSLVNIVSRWVWVDGSWREHWWVSYIYRPPLMIIWTLLLPNFVIKTTFHYNFKFWQIHMNLYNVKHTFLYHLLMGGLKKKNHFGTNSYKIVTSLSFLIRSGWRAFEYRLGQDSLEIKKVKNHWPKIMAVKCGKYIVNISQFTFVWNSILVQRSLECRETSCPYPCLSRVLFWRWKLTTIKQIKFLFLLMLKSGINK